MRYAFLLASPPPSFHESLAPDPRLGPAVLRVAASTAAAILLLRAVELVGALYLRVLLAHLRHNARAYSLFGFRDEAENERVAAFLVSLSISKRKRRR